MEKRHFENATQDLKQLIDRNLPDEELWKLWKEKAVFERSVHRDESSRDGVALSIRQADGDRGRPEELAPIKIDISTIPQHREPVKSSNQESVTILRALLRGASAIYYLHQEVSKSIDHPIQGEMRRLVCMRWMASFLPGLQSHHRRHYRRSRHNHKYGNWLVGDSKSAIKPRKSEEKAFAAIAK